MLELLKAEADQTYTENGGLTYASSGSACLDLFASAGALRSAGKERIAELVRRAFAEDRTLTMKILFFGRDVREGLGERRFFRIALQTLAWEAPEAVKRNLSYVPELGRYDDLFCLWDTPCEQAMLEVIIDQLRVDQAAHQSGQAVSLLAKWMIP